MSAAAAVCLLHSCSCWLLHSMRLRLTWCCCRFWYMAFDRGEPPVHWIIQVDPRGETSLRRELCDRDARLRAA